MEVKTSSWSGGVSIVFVRDRHTRKGVSSELVFFFCIAGGREKENLTFSRWLKQDVFGLPAGLPQV